MVRKFCFLAVSLLFIGALIFNAAAFAVVPDADGDGAAIDTCDNHFREALHYQSIMAAKRELEMAQAIVLKPDSVLEYSCFRAHIPAPANLPRMSLTVGLPDMSDIMGGMDMGTGTSGSSDLPGGFSLPDMSDFMGDVSLPSIPTVPGIPGMQAISGNLVQKATRGWIDGNFPYSYGGDFYNFDGSADCKLMNAVWQQAKCRDYNSARTGEGKGEVGPPKDEFMMYVDIKYDDPRIYGGDCKQVDPKRATWHRAWSKTLRRAKAPPPAGQPHAIITHRPLLDPKNCENIKPVPTGLIVDIYNLGSPYPDAVCPAPGCWYNPDENSCN